MVSDCDNGPVRSSGRLPCSVCKIGVGSNSIFCNERCCSLFLIKSAENVQMRLDHLNGQRQLGNEVYGDCSRRT